MYAGIQVSDDPTAQGFGESPAYKRRMNAGPSLRDTLARNFDAYAGQEAQAPGGVNTVSMVAGQRPPLLPSQGTQLTPIETPAPPRATSPLQGLADGMQNAMRMQRQMQDVEHRNMLAKLLRGGGYGDGLPGGMNPGFAPEM